MHLGTSLRLRAFVVPAVALAALRVAAVPAVAAVPGTGCNVFPANNVWNTDISSLPVNANSAAWMAASGAASRNLHPDFGPSGDPNVPYGIPFNVIDPSHAKVAVSFQYASESDRGPYPFGADTTIEGGAASNGDRHALMLDKGSCTLYELYDAHYSSGGSTAGSGAVFNLNGNALRPAGWTSADAAGLPIFPGLLRLDEVNSGVVNHAIRFTLQKSAASYLWPARHQAGSGPAGANAPMGARFRMKAGVDISHYSQKAQVILRAFQHYGLIMADNGSNWFFQGDANNGWPSSLLTELKSVPAANFEAVDESSLMIDPNSAQARQPGGGTPPPPPPVVKPPVPLAAPAAAPAGPPTAAAAADPTAPPAGAGTSAPVAAEDHFAPPSAAADAPAGTAPLSTDPGTRAVTRTATAALAGARPAFGWWVIADVVFLLGLALVATVVFRRRSGN